MRTGIIFHLCLIGGISINHLVAAVRMTCLNLDPRKSANAGLYLGTMIPTGGPQSLAAAGERGYAVLAGVEWSDEDY